uniref:Uncharacterized protein n=1 Tax=Rhizophora mucronata TaxID=61149 RepID=A0A2P2QY02_RHIMU
MVWTKSLQTNLTCGYVFHKHSYKNHLQICKPSLNWYFIPLAGKIDY